MGKHFKFRICRVIPSFNSCRSKHPSTFPSNPVPLFLRFSPVNPHPIMLHYPTTTKTRYSSLKRYVSSAITSIASGCSSRFTTECLSQTDHSESLPIPEFYWEKEEEDRYHVVAQNWDEAPRQKIYNSSASGNNSCDDDVLFPGPPTPPNTGKKKRRSRRKNKTPTLPKNGISTSSGIDSELFSSEGYADDYDFDSEEIETLVTASGSLSTGYLSSELNPQLETIRETPFKRAVAKRKKKIKKVNRCVLNTSRVTAENGGLSSPEMDTPARLSLFLKRLMPCALEGKVRDSFAVVKKSEDPYEDFKISMLDMILEKEMFEEKDLEQLLECFLSLNSRLHHDAIVRAFSEIWDTLISRGSSSFRVSTSL